MVNLEHLKEYLENISYFSDSVITGDYIGTNQKRIKLKIVFPYHFPVVLPKIYVINLDELNLFIPHLEYDGLICYTPSNNVIFDRSNTEVITIIALKKAIKTLEDGIQGVNESEFRKEFIAFWDRQKNLQPIIFFASANDEIKTLEIFENNKDIIINDDVLKNKEAMYRFFPTNTEKSDSMDTLYLPLRSKNKVLPPNPRKGWTKKKLLNIVRKNCTQAKKAYFDKWINKKNDKGKLLILKIPISENNEVLIGYWLNATKQSIKKYTGPISPLYVRRFDFTYLLERTSGEHSFTNLNICIVGVGSVGSKLSNELANLGVAKMTLIDPEKFEADNLFRHELGVDGIKYGKPKLKVEVLQQDLEKKNPYLEVAVESMDILDIISSDPNYFDQFDYSFICIGDTMHSLEINRFFSKSNNKVFYSWVEPLGIGGHVLYIDYCKKGCFQCLNTDPNTGNIISNRSSLVKPGQTIEKTLASCRSAFVPYSSLTSREAAVKTVELFHKIVYKEITKNSVLTWLGDFKNFKDIGYQFSDRFTKNKNYFPTVESNFINNKCEICRVKP